MGTGRTKYVDSKLMDWSRPTRATEILIEHLNILRDEQLKIVLLKSYDRLISMSRVVRTGNGHWHVKHPMLTMIYQHIDDNLDTIPRFDQCTDVKIKTCFRSMLRAYYREELRQCKADLPKKQVPAKKKKNTAPPAQPKWTMTFSKTDIPDFDD